MNKLLTGLLLIASCAAAAEGGEKLRDPTRPLSFAVAEVSGPKLQLQALFQRSSGAEAIVNGQRVTAGDTVAGARIESISRNGLVYSFQGQRQTLRLRPEIPGIKENP